MAAVAVSDGWVVAVSGVGQRWLWRWVGGGWWWMAVGDGGCVSYPLSVFFVLGSSKLHLSITIPAKWLTAR